MRHRFDTRDLPSYDEYLEYCEDNNLDAQPKDSLEYLKWQAETEGFYIDEFLDGLKYLHIDYVIVCGELGLWDGKHEIYPKLINDERAVYKAVSKCLKDAYDFSVELVDGKMLVEVQHHDGINNFIIHNLSDKGLEEIAKVCCDNNLNPDDSWYKPFEDIEDVFL